MTLVLAVVAVAVLADVGVGTAMALSLIHLGGLTLAGGLALRAVGLRPVGGIQTFALAFVGGQATLPLFALFARWLPGPGPASIAGFSMLAILALAAVRARPARSIELPPAPAPVWWLSLGYLVLCVAIPLGSFSDGNLVREMYSDGFQRFGTIYALAGDVPPANPFAAAESLRYYWLSFLPMAWEWSLGRWSLFDVWKVSSSWSAFLLVPVLWSAMTALLRRKAAGWGVVLFGFVFASWEIFAGEAPRRALSSLQTSGAWADRLKASAAALLATDPDHVTGVVNRYSDQLLVEDFLYIPHDAWAIGVVISALLLVHWRRPLAAAVALSGLAGGNPFVGLPALAALCGLHLIRRGPVRGLALAGVAAMGSGLWFSTCSILASPPIFWFAGLIGALAVAARVERGRRPPRTATDPAGSPDVPRGGDACDAWSPRLVAASALGLILGLALAAPKPSWSVVGILALNYGPAFVAAVVALTAVAVGASWTRPWRGSSTFLFCALFGVALHALAAILFLQFRDGAPEMVRAASYHLGLEVNLFNLYHKASKFVRLGWAALGGLAVGAIWEHLRRRPAPALALGMVLLLPAMVTTVARPLTYVRSSPVDEVEAGRYLRRRGVDLGTTVLLEDFRTSAINQIAPVSVFFISPWSGGEPGLTHAVGSWADQYLPPARRSVSADRERLNRDVFQPRLRRRRLEDLIATAGIDYVLTREPYDLRPLARQVVDRPGGYLYEVVDRARVGPLH